MNRNYVNISTFSFYSEKGKKKPNLKLRYLSKLRKNLMKKKISRLKVTKKIFKVSLMKTAKLSKPNHNHSFFEACLFK